LPPLDEPELNTNWLLAPPPPPFAVRTYTAPPLVAAPSPVSTQTTPPVVPVLLPEPSDVEPPKPLVPLPTEMRATPARPPTLGPEPRATVPLFPSLDDPELNANRPPDPLAPLFVDPRLSWPLLEQVLSLPSRTIVPPDIKIPRPVHKWTDKPLAASLLLPALIHTSPA